MSRNCSVPLCSSNKRRNPEISFHYFPKLGKEKILIENKLGSKSLIDRHEAWKLKLKIFEPITKYTRVCSLHFSDTDYFFKDVNTKTIYLKKNAVPSRQLPKKNHIEPGPTSRARLQGRNHIMEKVDQDRYKTCLVPLCTSTTIKTPEKLFIHVPLKPDIRKKWLILARRDPYEISIKTVCYFCEDHFDLENEMENYIQFHIMGSVTQIRMKPGCLPSKFECQHDRKLTATSISSTLHDEKQQKTIIEDCKRDYDENKKLPETLKDNCTSTDDPLFINDEHIKTEQELQTELIKNEVLDESDLMEHQYAINDENIKIENEVFEKLIIKNVNINNILQTELIIKEEILEERVPMDHQQIQVNNSQLIKVEDIKIEQDLHTELIIKEEDETLEESDTCVVDEQTFSQRSNTASGEKPYSCDICYKTFILKSSLVRHRRIHTGEKLFPCDICDKKFIKNSHLTRHKRIHIGKKLFSCDVCDQTFTFQHNLVQHKRIHSGEIIFSCDVCDKTFAEQANLVSHRRIHKGEKNFSCDFCGETFTRQEFIGHNQPHADEMLVSCDFCEKTFTRQCDLLKHKRIHTREIHFSCDVCHEVFIQKSQLVQHNRIHIEGKPFSCDKSDKTFNQKRQFVQHKVKHGGEKSFSCDVCDKKFAHKRSVVRHKHTHN